ncbi:MAG: Txe/YoeB family addiction module toxin [Notoacmeibacter sp.]|nr:Txe/YoeB family addiction module toxin [Notoacmeibacter sp.]MCC0031911.1 Txe/YoeB family addiction module toxin [Brucellaceae bacterium]
MIVAFDDDAWEDFCYWIDNDAATADKLRALIKDVRRSPFAGLGKPEPLRGAWQGFWSRRITGEHRLVYRVSGSGDGRMLEIAQCRYHYGRR